MATRGSHRNRLQRRSHSDVRRSRVEQTHTAESEGCGDLHIDTVGQKEIGQRNLHIKRPTMKHTTEGMMEGNKKTHRPLKHEPRRQRGSFPATLCLRTCLSTCQLGISHGWCSRGARLRADAFQHRGPLSGHEMVVMWRGTSLGQPALQS